MPFMPFSLWQPCIHLNCALHNHFCRKSLHLWNSSSMNKRRKERWGWGEDREIGIRREREQARKKNDEKSKRNDRKWFRGKRQVSFSPWTWLSDCKTVNKVWYLFTKHSSSGTVCLIPICTVWCIHWIMWPCVCSSTYAWLLICKWITFFFSVHIFWLTVHCCNFKVTLLDHCSVTDLLEWVLQNHIDCNGRLLTHKYRGGASL